MYMPFTYFTAKPPFTCPLPFPSLPILPILPILPPLHLPPHPTPHEKQMDNDGNIDDGVLLELKNKAIASKEVAYCMFFSIFRRPDLDCFTFVVRWGRACFGFSCWVSRGDWGGGIFLGRGNVAVSLLCLPISLFEKRVVFPGNAGCFKYCHL